jgi:hypothetical protein
LKSQPMWNGITRQLLPSSAHRARFGQNWIIW